MTAPAASSERVFATYRIETPLDPRVAAESLAGEQSSGTFVAVPGETEELKRRFAARVESIELEDRAAEPALPGSRGKGPYQRALVRVSWPIHNFGRNLPTFVSTLQGNLYELSQFSGLKLLDFEAPDAFLDGFAGPRFGSPGTRKLCGAAKGPLIGTIIKPSIGLSPEETAELVGRLAEAGIDFVKDDELMADPPHSPFPERVAAILRVIRRHEDRTGKRVMYAFNLSGEWDDMRRHYDLVAESGGSCVMVSLNTVGLAGVKHLCDLGRLPVHGHRNGWGMLNRHPLLGMDFAAYQRLWRLAGVDHLHVNGLSNKFWEPDDSVVRSIAACRQAMGRVAPIMPVISSGQWGGQAPETYRRTGTDDLLYLAGGGILAHPRGPADGVRALRKWWEAALEGLSAEEAARRDPLLAESAAKFGRAK